MSSFMISKAEVVVLFDFIGATAVPIGIRDLPDIDADEYQRIFKSFTNNKLFDKTDGKFRPDKGLELYLNTIIKANKIMLFNYGINGRCIFNATMYFAKSGLVSILNITEDAVKFINIDSVDDLMLFIPNISQHISQGKNDEIYISYILFDKDFSVIHCTRFDYQKNMALIVETQRNATGEHIEIEIETEISEYVVMLNENLKEVYDAAGC